MVCADCGETVPASAARYMEGAYYCNTCLYICTACMEYIDPAAMERNIGLERRSRCKYLMPLPEDASLTMGGYESSETDAHLIDNGGNNVYGYRTPPRLRNKKY